MKKAQITGTDDEKPTYPDQFMATLRQLLEHIDDAPWLQRQAPFAATYFSRGQTNGRAPQLALTGQPELDHLLRAIWHGWEGQPLSPLQRLLWEAVCALPPQKEPNYQVVLLLTYFQPGKPKQSTVIRALAISKATYYRHLEGAIEALAARLMNQLQPALRLEMPAVRPLIGRDPLLANAFQLLQKGAVVQLVGGSGLGKTSLGAHLAQRWGAARTFWYTFRPALSDQLDQLLFALAYFFQQQGAPTLWLHLTSDPRGMSVDSALATIRQSLEALRATPPLFCFDEVDLLLPSDPQAADRYGPLRTLLEALAQSPRAGAPLLCLGQKLLLEPDPEHCLIMARLTAEESHHLLRQAGLELSPAALATVVTYTRGNPLLLRLFAIWQRLAGRESDALHQMTATVSFDWFWVRLRQHLGAREEEVLGALAVHQGATPRDLWQKQQKTVEKLITMNLVDSHADDSISLHPTIRTAIERTLSAEQRQAHHLAAALAYEQRATFTRAAYHYIHGGRPEVAVWLWHRHQERELQQGQAGAALALFAPLAQQPLPHPADQKALHLLLAALYSLTGQPQDGLQSLAQVAWSPGQATTALAHEVRGHLLSHQGEIERALAEYRHSLDLITHLRADQTINLRTTMSRHQLIYLRDLDGARQAAQMAQFEVAVLHGEIESATGNYLAALRHYQAAEPLAATLNNPYTSAKFYEALGILHAYHAQLAPALTNLQKAGDYYQAYGNEVCAIGMTQTNRAWAYLMARRYIDVPPLADAALAYFTRLGEPYWIATNQTNLAEAHCYLGNLAQAEAYAEAALRLEEGSVRPYCLYILGQIRRRQGHFAPAEHFCREAIATAEANRDPWALGPAWRALGETYRDWGKADQAHSALQETLAIYQRLGVEAEIAYCQHLLRSVSP